MQLDPYLNQFHEQFAQAVSLGDERTRQIAGQLSAASEPALRLAILAALSAAADEVTAALLDHPGSPAVSIRLDGEDARVVVDSSAPTAPVEARADDTDASARISLRLSEALKSDVDAAAARDGVSVNAWLVRAASAALNPNPFAQLGARIGDLTGGGRNHGGAQRLNGWIDG